MRLPALTRCRITPDVINQHEVDWEKVATYVVALRSGAVFPPVVVARYGGKFMPIDGHHRLYAHARLNRECDALVCDGEAFEDFCIEIGHDGDPDRMVLAEAERLLNKE